jgi:hypothetical protein
MFYLMVLYDNYIIPEPTARVLIPPGYLPPGKRKQ